ncbi:hypothetical protein H0H93_014208 [Arthromyces matolae]|nr:hypothetical protein H0H93_014208 [Arthromyces matolae]
MTSTLKTSSILLPLGSKPGWELEPKDEEQKKSIAESCVLVQALRQSRDKWLYSTFPKFSSKYRGAKATDPPPPPHTIQTRGKCDLKIGPHIFPDTTIFEVHYLPSQPSSIVLPTYQPPSAGTWQAKTPYSAYASATSVPDTTSTALPTSSSPVTTISPALINQVNAAASSNPTLANLLQLAAGGLATPDQLKTLGLLIQSLAEASQSTAFQSPTPSSILTPSIPPVKEFDLVLEFRENTTERWVFPRTTVTCQRTQNSHTTHSLSQIVIKACVPFSTTSLPATTPEQVSSPEEPQVVTFTLEHASLTVWDTISRWAGSQETLQQNKKPIEHVYLGYQLSEGPLLSQLQIAAAPTYTMKSLKLAATNYTRTKRKYNIKSKTTATQESTSTDQKPPAKRKRTSQQNERSVALPIQCVSCGAKDVPLIMGGRYCRPCGDATRAASDCVTQPLPSSRTTSYVPATSIQPDSMTPITPTPPAPQPTNLQK